MRRREDASIQLSAREHQELTPLVRARRSPQAVARRVRIVLLTAEGLGPGAVGERLRVSQPTVRK